MIAQAELKEVLHYEPTTGIFTWKRRTDKIRIGDIAGTLNKGYVMIRVNGKIYAAHKLAWLYIYDKYLEFPKENIDHINCIRNDNRIENLRIATTTQNGQNVKQARPSNKSTGLLEAYTHQGKFVSYIRAEGKNRNLGVFNTAQEAHEAYIAAKRKLHEFGTI